MAGFFAPSTAIDSNLRDFLPWFYPGSAETDYNLEEVLAFLDISRSRLQLWGIDRPERKRFPKGELYSELLRFVKQRLTIPAQGSCPLHTALLRTLAPKDSIVSLNYDVIVERSLREIERPDDQRPYEETRLSKVPALIGTVIRFMQPTPSLIDREREGGFYLKLHGSLDWLYCPTPGCYNNANMYSVEVSGRNAQEEGAPCRYCGSALQMYIVPPVATKRLEDRGRMAFIWNLALREIVGAEQLTIIGLSLAPSDFEVRWLLRQAILLRDGSPLKVSVVNQNDEHADRVFRYLPSGVTHGDRFNSIQDYIDAETSRRGLS
jgi:hypothetical protein